MNNRHVQQRGMGQHLRNQHQSAGVTSAIWAVLTLAALGGLPACGSQTEDQHGGSGGTGPLLPSQNAGNQGQTKKCTRVETASAVTIVRPEPFDVVIVADNSGSIGWSRDSLSQGLQNLLKYVHGQQVRFFLLTPTQYEASSAAARDKQGSELVTYESDVTRQAHQNAVTQYVQTCTDTQGQPADCERRFYIGGEGLSVQGEWLFRMPAPIAAVTPEMSAQAISEQQAKIQAAILALGTTGAELEQPICTLNRYIRQAGEQLPKHAVFVVLSDEDDVSRPDQCLAKYSYSPMPGGSVDSECQSDCDYYQYSMRFEQALQTIEARCIQIDDQGIAHPESYTTISSASSATFCDPQKSTCSEADVASLREFCGADGQLQGCSVKCDAASIHSCTVERADAGLDLCTQRFSEASVNYENLADYCARTRPGMSPWQSCSVTGYRRGGRVLFDGEELITPVVPSATTLPDMAQAFHDSARGAFGAGGYFVESIIFDPSFSCPLQGGQSHGTTLRGLATSSQDVFPICSDYAPALQRIQGFAQKLVQTDFTLMLKSDEELESVTVRNLDGVTRTLAASDYVFDPAASKLRLAPGTLTPSDANLDLVIADSCVEIIR